MRTEASVDLFSKPADVHETAPRLAGDRPPRGLTSGGWVRTTGWLQFGHQPVSSSLVATLAGLLWALVAAAALVRTVPVAAGVLVLTVPVVCGGSWWLFTTWLKPASPARNIGTKPAGELTPGDVVRLHGSIGPVGQVKALTFGENVRVDFHGGVHQSWSRRQEVHIAELLG